eukprot:m.159583 g.159583  ORF g.159583 m.159583 type:complete len:627 (+) comp13373_c0_seq3:35-1915(+)
MSDEELDFDEIESAFTFLGESEASNDYLDVASKPENFKQFARKYFQDKAVTASKYTKVPIRGPLLKQIWGDDDAERMLAVWYAIVRFMGDIPSDENDTEPMDNLQKVQFICNVGITRLNTRDEIYSQVCKQLTENPSKPSHARGWILLALICGSFLPSDALLGVLKNFINAGPPHYAPFVLKQLERTIKNGSREHPPTACELMMCFKKQPISFSVHFFVGSHDVECDSQSTNQELVVQCYDHESLSPELGLGIYIASPTMDMMTSVSSGYTHVLDTVFEYENLASQGGDWRLMAAQQPWVAILRKEVFAPWFEGRKNIELIYSQVMDGIIRGIYTSDDNNELALLLAQRYLVKFGNKLDEKQLLDDLRSHPIAGMQRLPAKEWADLATEAFDAREYYSDSASAEDAKVDVVQFARSKWFMEFSRRYRVNVDVNGVEYENATVFLNCRGLFVVAQSAQGGQAKDEDVSDRILFAEMVEVSILSSSQKGSLQNAFTISFVHENGIRKAKFFAANAITKKLRDLSDQYFRGMTYRSKYCIATINYKAPGSNSEFLSFAQGDLIILPKIWAEVEEGGWATGVCERTKSSGDFPTANVVVLPSLFRPANSILTKFREYVKTIAPADNSNEL